MPKNCNFNDVKEIKNVVVEKYENGIITVVETEKNEPNNANRAKRMFCLGVQGMQVKHEIPADYIVVSIGYNANQKLYEEIKEDHTYLIGDGEKPTNIMDAIWSAYETVMKL